MCHFGGSSNGRNISLSQAFGRRRFTRVMCWIKDREFFVLCLRDGISPRWHIRSMRAGVEHNVCEKACCQRYAESMTLCSLFRIWEILQHFGGVIDWRYRTSGHDICEKACCESDVSNQRHCALYPSSDRWCFVSAERLIDAAGNRVRSWRFGTLPVMCLIWILCSLLCICEMVYCFGGVLDQECWVLDMVFTRGHVATVMCNLNGIEFSFLHLRDDISLRRCVGLMMQDVEQGVCEKACCKWCALSMTASSFSPIRENVHCFGGVLNRGWWILGFLLARKHVASVMCWIEDIWSFVPYLRDGVLLRWYTWLIM
jgi:hypothetical protein